MKPNKQKIEVISKLAVESQTYREFLQQIFIYGKKFEPSLSQARVSDRAGFSSRSLLSQITTGKRRPTSQAIIKISKALAITGKTRECFELLIYLEHQDLDPSNRKLDQLKERLVKVRWQLSHDLSTKPELKESSAAILFSSAESMKVFASLGTVEKGATIDEIISRTRLPKNLVQKNLNLFLSHKIINQNQDRYFVNTDSLDYAQIGEVESFRKRFQTSAQALAKRAFQSSLESGSELFFLSTIPVRKNQLPELKLRLKQTIIDFLDQAQDDNGDSITEVFIALHQS